MIRRGGKDVALIASAELDSILATLYLLRSPANAARLDEGFRRSERNEGKPETVAELRKSVGLD